VVNLIAQALRAVNEAAYRAFAPKHVVEEGRVPAAPGMPARVTVEGPFLVADLYWKDLAGRPSWNAFLNAKWGPDADGHRHLYAGALLKATEGTRYYGDAIAWFSRGWRALGASERYGVDFVRGAYHYLRFDQDGEKQAEYYLRTIHNAGGWDHGDMLPVVDVEFGSDTSANRQTAREIVERNARAFVAKVKAETGRDVILYGGSALSELRIKERLGCRWLWPAAYSKSLSAREATSIGWRFDEVAMWQYTDGRTCKAVTTRGTVLPRVVQNFGAVDCSVFVGGKTWADLLHVMCGDPGHDLP
jgi:GH25 family lysozyme M1 (1,4-beta-N-acetylmuramidase)